MKNILLLIGIIVAFTLGVQAQNAYVSANGTNFNLTSSLDAGDTVSATGTFAKVIGVGAKKSVQLYSIMVTIDSISGTPTETIILAGSMDNLTFTTITTVTWAGTSSDTTFHYTDIATGIAWPYVRVRATGSAGKGQVTTLTGRFIDEVR